MIQNEFYAEIVDYIPAVRNPGVLYVSVAHRTAVHECACGCGNKVVTPLNSSAWTVRVADSRPTLHPSIGNWGFPCRSHYMIQNGRVVWAKDWSSEEVSHGADRDRRDRREYFASRTMRGRVSRTLRTLRDLLRRGNRRNGEKPGQVGK